MVWQGQQYDSEMDYTIWEKSEAEIEEMGAASQPIAGFASSHGLDDLLQVEWSSTDDPTSSIP